jgi:hypothetical protein
LPLADRKGKFMKIVITGHTGGLGKAIYDFYSSQWHEVIGLSRTTGHTLPEKNDEVVQIAQGCDIFFNNAYSGLAQLNLIKDLYKTTPMVISGSMASQFYAPGKKIISLDGRDLTKYCQEKYELEQCFNEFKKTRPHPMLLLRMGYLENHPNRNFIPFSQVIECIELWRKNPRVNLIELNTVVDL